MELNFLGRGAAFNPKEGNNSAYFIEGKELFLIDCGESVFEKLITKGILNKVDIVNVFITHTHSDHVGSLGSLVLYAFYNMKNKVNIIMRKGAELISSIDSILRCEGCFSESYNYIFEESLDGKYKSFNSIRYVDTVHSDNLNCYSLIFETYKGILYYSGDTRELDTLRKIIHSGKRIDKLFIDTNSNDFEGNPHVYIGDLNDCVPLEFKSKVYCMHLNDDECISRAEEYGFNVVEL